MDSNQENRLSMNSGKQKESQKSELLSNDQNTQLFELLGNKKVSQATAVAQLFSTEPPAHSIWLKRHTGVLCFVKDFIRKSYYMQMYCLDRNELIWEHEVYEPFAINRSRPFALTFEGQDRIYLFSFVSDMEAALYLQAARTYISNQARKKERRVRPFRQVNINDEGDGAVHLRKPKHSISTKPTPPPTAKHSISTTGPGYSTALTIDNSKNNKVSSSKKGRKKVLKEEIGMPTGFTHVSHVGWNSFKGFEFTGDNDEVLKPFLEKAGVSPELLSNRKTKAFILDFIQTNNVIESIKSESGAPPVPQRNSMKVISEEPSYQKPNRVAPPPPPNRPNLANVVPKPPRMNVPDPPKRNPQVNAGTAPPPPPPPPPMAPPPPTMTLTPPPVSSNKPQSNNSDPRDALLESIRQGKTLKKVGEQKPRPKQNVVTNVSGGTGTDRNDLLSEIRQGTKLRPVEEREINEQPITNDDNTPSSDALAFALKKALEQRKGAIHSDSDEDTDESFDNDDEWDD